MLNCSNFLRKSHFLDGGKDGQSDRQTHPPSHGDTSKTATIMQQLSADDGSIAEAAIL